VYRIVPDDAVFDQVATMCSLGARGRGGRHGLGVDRDNLGDVLGERNGDLL
jgi:hypothetical protein